MRHCLGPALVLLLLLAACSTEPVIHKRARGNPFSSAPSDTAERAKDMTTREPLRPITPPASNLPPNVPQHMYPK